MWKNMICFFVLLNMNTYHLSFLTYLNRHNIQIKAETAKTRHQDWFHILLVAQIGIGHLL